MDNSDKTKLDTPKPRYEHFLRLFRTNEDRLFGFILRLLPNFTVAEDVMQETMMTMWRKFDEFKEGSSFSAWGMRIARFKVLEYHHRDRRHGMVHFNDELLDQLSDLDKGPDKIENTYLEALHGCVDKLKDQNRDIVKFRYSRDMSIKQIADELSVSVNVIYKSMSKIHYVLQKCIERTLSAWELT
ncbi:MAG: sigma-70 family RNA polymerase sigma factor [Planctomycetaceae bacterium]|nr:sigma-70 family RNA polymerase sigma factor [Planctomycetaceae bacterium]